MTKKTIEIFRAGTHIGQDGKRYVFSDADVQAIAAAYDPAKFSAPVVIGHPKSEDPAYGWADTVRVRDDGVMEADLDKVDPAFADLVEKGSYKKVSAAFYPADHPNNPTPGQLHLRHIGFLGAAAPGVQGLAPVAFAEGDDAFIAFASDQELLPVAWLARSVGRMMSSLRDHFIETLGVEKTEKILAGWETDRPAEIAGQLEAVLDKPGPRFAEAEQPEADATRAAELDQREADITAREQAAAARETETAQAQAQADRDARQAEDAAFADGLIEAGRLPPGHRATVLGFCESLAGSEMIAFAEGEEARAPRQAFKDFLANNLGVSIRFEEIAGGDGLEFAEGRSVDDHAAAIETGPPPRRPENPSARPRPLAAPELAARSRHEPQHHPAFHRLGRHPRARAQAVGEAWRADWADAIGEVSDDMRQSFIESGDLTFDDMGEALKRQLRAAIYDAFLAKPINMVVNAVFGGAQNGLSGLLGGGGNGGGLLGSLPGGLGGLLGSAGAGYGLGQALGLGSGKGLVDAGLSLGGSALGGWAGGAMGVGAPRAEGWSPSHRKAMASHPSRHQCTWRG